MEAPMIAAIQQETDVRPEMEPLWNTFERDRARLYDPYLGVPYGAQSGLSPSELEQVYQSELEAHPPKATPNRKPASLN